MTASGGGAHRSRVRGDLGDFQTPPELAAALIQRLGPIGARWPRVLEPSCGRGVFLEAAADSPAPPRELVGIEIQQAHVAEARARLAARALVVHADMFDLDLRADLPWSGGGPLLVVGNPPWITNAELGRLGSDNRPPRRNVKGLHGLEARTGASNFDLGEAFWLKLIDELADQRPTIALLCKSSVARAVLQHLDRIGRSPADAELIEIDARRWFRAAVSACFLKLTLGEGKPTGRVAVFDAPEASRPSRAMAVIEGGLVSDVEALKRLEGVLGRSALCWRQGIKHDAASVMELVRSDDGTFHNRLGEAVRVEPSFIYPLSKGSDLVRPVAERPRRGLIVTQTTLGAETRDLAERAPALWSYLQGRAARFEKRRSSIYRGAPPYAMFGIGPYAFAPFKSAVSGLHRPPRFRALGPVDGRPTVCDDTCYILPCPTALEASVLTAAANDPITGEALAALSFVDAKRPVTKSLLQRINLGWVLKRTDPKGLRARIANTMRDDLGLEPPSDGAVDSEVERIAALLSADGDSGPSPPG